MRAQGRGESSAAAAVEVEREALRQIPQTIDLDSARTPDELDAIWPAELPPR